MSEEGGGFGLTLAEKFFGLLLLIVGGLTSYYTFTSISSLGSYIWLFGFLSVFLLALGLLLMTAKTE
ncbi:MAG: hypothetical protein QXV21_00475 [Candidatus Bathyarchaeia archaeon]